MNWGLKTAFPRSFIKDSSELGRSKKCLSIDQSIQQKSLFLTTSELTRKLSSNVLVFSVLIIT